jgi:hypothetical protein
MAINRIVAILLPFLISIPLFAANLHNQTNANLRYNDLKIKVLDDVISTDLDSPGVEIKKFPNGRLKQLNIHLINAVIVLHFHPVATGPEKVSLYQNFRVFNGLLMLDGPSKTLDIAGRLITESNWSQGKLHGAQNIYDSSGILREERHYDHGFPVKTWSLYYDNAKKASSIEFPSNLDEWLTTEEGDASNSNNDSIYSMVYSKSVPAKEVWYNMQGSIRKEIFYTLTKEGDGFDVDYTGKVLNYDDMGNVVRSVELTHGAGFENRVYDSLGLTYHDKTTWFSNQPFKKQSFIVKTGSELIKK